MLGLLRLLWSKRWRMLAGFGVLLVVDGAQLVVPLIVRRAIDRLALGLASFRELAVYGLWLLGLALVVLVFRFFWRYLMFGAAREIERDFRDRLYYHTIRLPSGFFVKTKTGEIMALATNDLEAVRMALAMGSVSISDVIIMGSFSLGAMVYISPKLTLWVLGPLGAIILVVIFFGPAIHRRFRRVQESFARLAERAREMFSGIRVIKAFVQEEGATRDFSEVNEEYLAENINLVKVWGFFHPTIGFLVGSATAVVLWFGGRQAIMGDISLGDLVAFTSYIFMLAWPMVAIGWVTNLVQRASASLKRIHELLSEEEEPYGVGVGAGTGRSTIEIRNLSFGYNGYQVLKNITLSVEEGATLGIVGRTGSGKSTLVSLIPRIYDPPEGSVFVEGVDVLTWELGALRRRIGFVPQEAFLFSATIRENIGLGDPSAPDEKLIWAAKMAEIWDEIKEMGGLDLTVGEWGVGLSGGQRQRIALARALLLDPPILILDDTLSAVDAETEEKILANLREYMKGRTSIVISHRLSAVKDADWIVVLEKGRVVEEGTHQDLLRLGGIYAAIWEAQSSA